MAYLQPAPQGTDQPSYPAGLAEPVQAPPVQSSAGQADLGFDTQSYDNCGCDSYGCCDSCCCQPCCPCWGITVGPVLLAREYGNRRTFSYDGNDEAHQLLDADFNSDQANQDSSFSETVGPMVRFAWFNRCCCTGCEAIYWGLYPNDEFAYAYPTQVGGPLNAIDNFDQLDYNGLSADNYTNGAEVHRLRRRSELHNAEFNHLWHLSRGRGCSPWSFRALAGFRYFRFVDDLEFASDPNEAVIDGDVDELYYTIDTRNNLYGLQVGGLAERRCCRHSRWSLTCGAKVGAFINEASAHSFIGGAAGVATVNNGPNNGQPWDIYAEKTDFAMMAELQAGLAYRICNCWRLRADYRVIGITGVALPTNQIYPDLRGLQDVQFLATNGDLILHGAFVGFDYGY